MDTSVSDGTRLVVLLLCMIAWAFTFALQVFENRRKEYLLKRIAKDLRLLERRAREFRDRRKETPTPGRCTSSIP